MKSFPHLSFLELNINDRILSLCFILCHGRKVEFEIQPVESPIGVLSVESPIGHSAKINLVESSIYEIWVFSSGPKSNEVGRYFYLDAKTLDEVIVLQALDAGTNWAVVTNKCCCRSIGASCSTKCHV